mmetsp:Transcript_15280/g.38741  ORF Transcript_15280/g.38741 Transcript_15280/m.38741 type:complete len:212 (-) Transcript_15280:317-952(-)
MCCRYACRLSLSAPVPSSAGSCCSAAQLRPLPPSSSEACGMCTLVLTAEPRAPGGAGLAVARTQRSPCSCARPWSSRLCASAAAIAASAARCPSAESQAWRFHCRASSASPISASTFSALCSHEFSFTAAILTNVKKRDDQKPDGPTRAVALFRFACRNPAIACDDSAQRCVECIAATNPAISTTLGKGLTDSSSVSIPDSRSHSRGAIEA